jgi:phage/plasmid primase-like uncharacterized protein
MTTTTRLDAAIVRESARGRWPGLILPALGVDVPNNPRRHAPCPVCGGHDRFRFDDRDGFGSWFCNQCDPQAGDGFDLVMNTRRLKFPDALHLVAGVLGLESSARVNTQRPRPAPPARIDRKARAFQYELAALDLRLRAERIVQAANRIDVSGLSDEALDRVMQSVTSAYADRDRAELFGHVADGLMDKHYTNTMVAR